MSILSEIVKRKYLLGYIGAFAAIAIFFSYRLTKVPPGLTIDEAAFGYNAVLLGETGRDQNGRFLPFFVLSIEGRDWRQPVTQYFMAIFFKVFGANLFNLRFTSIVVMLVTLVLIIYLSRNLFGELGGILSAFLFLTVPLIMIQSHLGLDNIMPLPFVLVWMIGIYNYLKAREVKWLLIAGISLGIGFYTYKAMRAVVPVWCVLTALFLAVENMGKRGGAIRALIPAAVFSVAVFPFFAIIPLLELKYAGAVFDRQGFNWSSVYDFLYPFFSSFDPSFLFISGDATAYHSTGKHGMFLLASLPLFLTGLFKTIKSKDRYLVFLIIAFFSAPLLFGFVNSVHRASRLMAVIPLYVLVSSAGGLALLQAKKRLLFGGILLLMLVNYGDFVNYYWYEYPKMTGQWFSRPVNDSYLRFSQKSEELGLLPFISKDVYKSDGENAHFFEAAYFPEKIQVVDREESLPAGGIIMTPRREVPGLEKIDLEIPFYYLHFKSS